MLTNKDIMNMELNQNVNYGMFKNLKFKDRDEAHVILEDKAGDTKKVYISLFMKYGSLINITKG